MCDNWVGCLFHLHCPHTPSYDFSNLLQTLSLNYHDFSLGCYWKAFVSLFFDTSLSYDSQVRFWTNRSCYRCKMHIQAVKCQRSRLNPASEMLVSDRSVRYSVLETLYTFRRSFSSKLIDLLSNAPSLLCWFWQNTYIYINTDWNRYKNIEIDR